MSHGPIAFPTQPEIAGAAASLRLDMDMLAAPAGPSADARQGTRDMADTAARTIVIALFTVMAVRLGLDFMETGRLTGLLLLASEALVVLLTLFRRAPAIVDRSTRARLLTALSMVGPPLVRPTAFGGVAPEVATVLISAFGLLVVIGGKLSLGRSFGLIPANRGIVCSGLYRAVRHPIYLGYVLTHVAFVAANPTLWNLILLTASDIALMARAVCEERTLARDLEYRQYQQVVRWRVLPGVF
jgi:protein-S-isoprenylcysteine O-methyltransferase Ste14